MNMISKSGKNFDVVLITAEYYEDHPYSPAGVIAKVLDAKGFNVGIIEKPVANSDFLKLGIPKLAFCVTSGSIDSMLNNYTPLKKKREEDEYSRVTKMPDRALIVYCNKIKELFKDCGTKIIIGGIEASLRRFAHYDYWDNKIRRSILFDTRADILVYGNGEKQIIEICDRLKKGERINGILGTCIISKELKFEEGNLKFETLPAFSDVKNDDTSSKKNFCKMQIMFSNSRNLAQKYDNNYVIQYKFPEYTTEDLDWIYGLDYSRELREDSLLKLARFSVQTHRGCIGRCNFCSIALHQGDKIISRSEKSILQEIEKITKNPKFNGAIDDLGGPSANMYGMDCDKRNNCGAACINCKNADMSHSKLLKLMKKARQIKGVKKIFVRSGIRYDIALKSDEYIHEISKYHVSGSLKIAPEHVSEKVLKLMNKESHGKFDEFCKKFYSINEGDQELKYYFMVGHPGDNMVETEKLRQKIRKLKNVEQFQMFTPTPMSNSTCMYWTGLNPFTMEKIDVVYDYNTKKQMKRLILDVIG